MLAKPEYFSPPDEVCCWQGVPCQRCCWQGRCSGTAGWECHGEEDGGTVAKSHREDAAGRSSLHRRQSCTIGKQLRVDAETPDAGRPVEKRLCRNAYAETPMQKRRFRNADSETPIQKRRCSNATLERYCTKAMRSVGFDVSHAAQEIK